MLNAGQHADRTSNDPSTLRNETDAVQDVTEHGVHIHLPQNQANANMEICFGKSGVKQDCTVRIAL